MPVFYFRRWLPALLAVAVCCAAPPAALAQAPAPATAAGASTLTGTVQSTDGEALPGATVFVRGTYLGTSTDNTGRFRLTIPAGKVAPGESITLEISYLGYESLTKLIDPADAANVTVSLTPAATTLGETVVSASRVQQTLAEAPVTVEKVSAIQINRLATPDILAGLATLKGVDVSSSALLMSSVSTRGFNSAKSERVIQLADYIDTQSPSLNVNAGNLLGIPEVDMESVDVLHGPSSALYGANAFNGVVLFNSKDPFVFEGLTARLRGGSRAYADAQVRYAKKFTPRLAAKLNLSYQQANDFMPTNFAAQDRLLDDTNNPEGSVFGYNAVNRYGDSKPLVPPLTPTSPPTEFTQGLGGVIYNVYVPGFAERDLVADDNRTYGIRIQPTLSYLLTDNLKATGGYRFSRGTTTYQSTSRYRFKNLETQQFFAELKSDKFFVRAYTTGDDGGDTYDMNFLGAFLQNQLAPMDPKINPEGKLTYGNLFSDVYKKEFIETVGENPSLPLLQRQQLAARSAYDSAAATQLQPGSAEFNRLREKIITDNTPGQGARIRPRSRLTDLSAQHQFKFPAEIGLIVGGAYRDFRNGSDGRLFSDTTGSRINNYEYGAYAQATKGFMENRLKFAFAARLDDFKNFDPAFSPRASVTYAIGKDLEHNFRLSYSRAFRSPAQLDQYILLDLQRAILVGNVGNGFEAYDLSARPVVLTLSDPAVAAKYRISVPALKLEQVNTVEGGYRAALGPKVTLDASVYFSRYTDFIGARRFFSNTDGTLPTVPELNAAAASGFTNPALKTRVVQAWTNSPQQLETRGATFGLTYAQATYLSLTGSYSYNELTTTDLPTDFQTFFNTPKHKFTLGASGALATDFSYGLSYRWAQSFRYEMPFAVGQLAAPSSLDVTLGYHVQRLKTTFQAGATNVLDATNIQVYGAPSLGRIVFAGVLIDVK